VNNVEVNEQQIEQYIPRIMEEFKDMSKEEFIKRFASIEFNSFLEYYKNAPDLNAPIEDGRRPERGERGDDRAPRQSSGMSGGGKSEYTRLFINLGSVDEFNRGDLLGYICNNTKISGRTVGKIDVKGVYSFFEVQHEDVEKVTNGFKDIEFKGRPVRIEISGEGTSEKREGSYQRREGGGGGGYNRERSGSGEKREGGFNRERTGGNAGGGFRDFSGKRREDRGERRRRF
jgi:ATP-dependent RNA helicase DeaD